MAVCLLCHWAAGDVTTAVTSTDGVVATTEDPGLRFEVAERDTDSLTLQWKPPYDGEILGYEVTCQKGDSEDLIFSPPLGKEEREYTMENLMINADYRVCLRAASPAGQPPGSVGVPDVLTYDEELCANTTTIPYMRKDSVIVLCASLGYIFLMIIIGIICYQCAKRRLHRNDDDEEEEPEEEKVSPVPYRPAYVAPPSGAEPVRSSIEDPDIPYITPPVDQLSRNERMRYDAKV